MTQAILHNPDRFMLDLRQILSQGRKRIAFLIGAGAPVSIRISSEGRTSEGGDPLIPDIAKLTCIVLEKLGQTERRVIKTLFPQIDDNTTIETILTRIRRLSEAIGEEEIHGINGHGYGKIANQICQEIGNLVSCSLPTEPNPYQELITWIGGTHRDHTVEIFTPNYDLLFEEAFERARLPYFDGFSGSHKPFFDPTTIGNDNLPTRWSRLWKMHGSLGWEIQGTDIVRTGSRDATNLIYPDHLKYGQIQKQPYSAIFERLKAFLTTPDSLLLCSGFSFSDAHIAAVLDEALSSNSHTAVLAFQYNSLENEEHAKRLATRNTNFSVYARDGGVIFGLEGKWKLGQPPTQEWPSIRKTFWDASDTQTGHFILGDFMRLARFLALTQAESLLPRTDALPMGSASQSGEQSAQPEGGMVNAQP